MGVTTEDIAAIHRRQQAAKARAEREAEALELRLLDELLERRRERKKGPRPAIPAKGKLKDLAAAVLVSSKQLALDFRDLGHFETHWGVVEGEIVDTRCAGGWTQRVWKFRWREQ